jgi:hypothetical protein
MLSSPSSTSILQRRKKIKFKRRIKENKDGGILVSIAKKIENNNFHLLLGFEPRLATMSITSVFVILIIYYPLYYIFRSKETTYFYIGIIYTFLLSSFCFDYVHPASIIITVPVFGWIGGLYELPLQPKKFTFSSLVINTIYLLLVSVIIILGMVVPHKYAMLGILNFLSFVNFMPRIYDYHIGALFSSVFIIMIVYSVFYDLNLHYEATPLSSVIMLLMIINIAKMHNNINYEKDNWILLFIRRVMVTVYSLTFVSMIIGLFFITIGIRLLYLL